MESRGALAGLRASPITCPCPPIWARRSVRSTPHTQPQGRHYLTPHFTGEDTGSGRKELKSTQQGRGGARIQTQSRAPPRPAFHTSSPPPSAFPTARTSTRVPHQGASAGWAPEPCGIYPKRRALTEAVAGERTAQDSPSFRGSPLREQQSHHPFQSWPSKAQRGKGASWQRLSLHHGLTSLPSPHLGPRSRPAPGHPSKDFRHADSPSHPIHAPTALRTHHLSPLRPAAKALSPEESRFHGLSTDDAACGSREAKTGRPHSWPALAPAQPSSPGLQASCLGGSWGGHWPCCWHAPAHRQAILEQTRLRSNHRSLCGGEREPGDVSPRPRFLQGWALPSGQPVLWAARERERLATKARASAAGLGRDAIGI